MRLTIKIKFMILALIVGATVIGGIFGTFSFTKKQVIEDKKKLIEKDLRRIRNDILIHLDDFKDDAVFLSRIPSLVSVAQTRNSAENYKESKEMTRKIFSAFSRRKPWYMQIRYIDGAGQEIIRVDKESVSEEIKIVKEKNLQNKKSRDYFQQTVKLRQGDVYTSELDLNIEAGDIEVPYKPTIRFATPVFNEDGENKGIVVINILAENLLDRIRLFDPELYLLDEEYYFLFNDRDPEKQWSKYLKTGYRLTELDDYVFKEKKENNYFMIDRLEDNDQIIIFHKIFYDASNQDKYWLIGKVIDADDFFVDFIVLQNNIITLNLILFFVLTLVFVIFIIYTTKPINALTEAVAGMRKGNYDISLKSTTKDEFRDLIDGFNMMARSMREQQIEKYEFITSASHQLRTPSSGLMMQIEDLKEKLKKTPGCEGFTSSVEEISSNNDRIVVIINDLFKVLELGDKYLATNLKKTNIRNLFYVILKSFGEEVAVKKLKIRTDIPVGLTVKVDESRLKDALINLIDNAVTYSNEEGKIEIKAERDGAKVVFRIVDEGIGIPKKEQVHVFDKFFRAKNSYGKKSVGTGLGLVIARTIIEGHDGKIWLESEEDKGTTFYFSLPIG